MVDEYKVFDVNINGNLYEFFLNTYEGKIFLSITDLGGLADACPLHREQYEWIEPILAKISGVEQTWTTQWHIKTASALKKIEALFKKNRYIEE